MWQKEWMTNELMKKESQALVNSVTLKSCGVNSRCDGSGRTNSGVSSRVSNKGKGRANSQVDFQADSQDDFSVEFYNGHPVIRTTAIQKPVSTVDKIEVQVPQWILKCHQQMDIDDENRPRKQKNMNRDSNANRDQAITKTKMVPFWKDLRSKADVSNSNEKLRETVIPITLKELLSISPDLISHWFGLKRVPLLQLREKDLKEAFEVSAAKWIIFFYSILACRLTLWRGHGPSP